MNKQAREKLHAEIDDMPDPAKHDGDLSGWSDKIGPERGTHQWGCLLAIFVCVGLAIYGAGHFFLWP